jgi:hypothetical protein
MMLGIIRRSAVALTVAGTLFAVTAPPANAMDVGDPLGGTTFNVWLGHSLEQSIRLAPVPTSLNGYSVTATCTAVASPDASSTAVDECSVNGVGIGSRVSLPGESSAAATIVTAFRNTWVSACVRTSADFVESLLGPGTVGNPKVCYPVYLP